MVEAKKRSLWHKARRRIIQTTVEYQLIRFFVFWMLRRDNGWLFFTFLKYCGVFGVTLCLPDIISARTIEAVRWRDATRWKYIIRKNSEHHQNVVLSLFRIIVPWQLLG